MGCEDRMLMSLLAAAAAGLQGVFFLFTFAEYFQLGQTFGSQQYQEQVVGLEGDADFIDFVRQRAYSVGLTFLACLLALVLNLNNFRKKVREQGSYCSNGLLRLLAVVAAVLNAVLALQWVAALFYLAPGAEVNPLNIPDGDDADSRRRVCDFFTFCVWPQLALAAAFLKATSGWARAVDGVVAVVRPFLPALCGKALDHFTSIARVVYFSHRGEQADLWKFYVAGSLFILFFVGGVLGGLWRCCCTRKRDQLDLSQPRSSYYSSV